jgi:hypothetical protein
MISPVFENYERMIIAETVEKHYGPLLGLSEENVLDIYLRLQIESLDGLLLSNQAAFSLNQWLTSNQNMSMTQAVLVSKQIDLIQNLTPSAYSFNLVTTESHSNNDRLTMVAERFKLSIALAIIASISLILEIIKYFSGPKSPNNILIVNTEKKVKAITKLIPETINDVPKASKTCDEKNGTAYSVSSEIIRRATEGELETNKEISASQVLSFFKDLYSYNRYITNGSFYHEMRQYSFVDVFMNVDNLYKRIIKECDSDEDITQTDIWTTFTKEIASLVYGEKSLSLSILKKFFDKNKCPSFYALSTDTVTILGESHPVYKLNELKSISGSRTIVDALDMIQFSHTLI